ncbi:protoporphyrinogen oxidase [Salinibacterium sp. UTAS2018]|uniref:protoporphyrinogen oxidase n=1 Tax=Salinibacterium sp. UTAS2018 TaxID=2508880 RepID=UPI0010096774|nr:protoporphyrinogen oxidase [Salinibacterium sp. UTAS2018]QAV69045.1 protoporphyrinogen oxidase [Salinibacterium sp. UTAS2018]
MNVRLLILGFGIAVGYVVGARAGHERYDQMKGKATAVWESPRVTKARTTAEDYARTQAPILRDKAEAVAKATPGFVVEKAKDVAENTREFAETARTTAKDLADNAEKSARDFAESARETAKGLAGNAKESAKEIADRASATARGAVGRVSETAEDVRENANKELAELRERGESAIDRAFTTAGKARDEALASLDDEDDDDFDERPTT